MATEQAEIASRHAVYLERYKSHEFKQYEPFLQRIAKLIRVKLSGELIADEWTRVDLEKQLRSINKDIKLIQGEYTDELIKSSLTLADYEAGYEARSMSQMIDYDFELPSETQLKSAVFTNPLTVEGAEGGKLLAPFFKDMPNKSIDAVTNHIRAGYYEGLTTPQIIKNILGTKNLKYSNGKLSDLYRSTELVTRTGLQHVAAQASMETYKRNEDLIKGYEFLATLDYRTSSICRATDGKVYPKDKPYPQPPLHPNCRSTLLPTFKKEYDVFKKGATRPARDPKTGKVTSIPAKTSYYDWLKQQPPAFQDDIIGKTRGQLLREGGLTSRQFADLQLHKNFTPMTIKEMRAKEPLAFERFETKDKTILAKGSIPIYEIDNNIEEKLYKLIGDEGKNFATGNRKHGYDMGLRGLYEDEIGKKHLRNSISSVEGFEESKLPGLSVIGLEGDVGYDDIFDEFDYSYKKAVNYGSSDFVGVVVGRDAGIDVEANDPGETVLIDNEIIAYIRKFIK